MMTDQESSWWIGQEAVQVVGHSAYGGAVPVVFGIMDATARLGMRPTILATHPDVVRASRDQGFEVWEFPGIVREVQPLRDLAVAIRLSHALRQRGVQIVHTHTTKGGMVGRLAARLAGCRLVIHHTHGLYHSSLAGGAKRWAMCLLERLFGAMDDRQIFINTQHFDLAVAERIAAPAQARLCFNGIDAPVSAVDARAALRAEWSVAPETPVIGTVSRVEFEAKGLDAGLDAVALLASRVPEALWVVAGEGSDSDAFEHMVRSRGLSQSVRLLGHVDNGGALCAAFDVSFAPSRREGQSISVLEAMAARRPVVATRIAGIADLVVEGQTGLLTAVDDAPAMAGALERLLRDSEEAARFGVAARTLFEARFTRDAMVARVERLYQEALGLPVHTDTVITPFRAAHVRAAVDLHLAAFRGFFLSQLGAGFLRVYYSNLLQDPESIAYVAVEDGAVQGLVAGSMQPAGFYGRLLRRHWLAFAVAALPAVLRNPGIAARVARATRRPDEAPAAENVAGLYSLAVAPGLQGQGIGAQLVSRFLTDAGERGAGSVRLETDADGNDDVNRFYRNQGFAERRAFQTPEGRRMLEFERALRHHEGAPNA